MAHSPIIRNGNGSYSPVASESYVDNKMDVIFGDGDHKISFNNIVLLLKLFLNQEGYDPDIIYMNHEDLVKLLNRDSIIKNILDNE